MQWVPGQTDNTEILLVDGDAVAMVASYPRALRTYAGLVVLEDMSQESFDSPGQAKKFAEELYS